MNPLINCVDIWLLNKAALSSLPHRWEEAITTEEQQRANRFHFAEDRSSFVLYHACKRIILSSYLQLPPKKIDLSIQENGKPFLKNKQLFFNLSHTRDYAILAVSRDIEVGVDIEKHKNLSNHLDIAKRFFHSDEFQYLLEIEDVQKRQEAFFVFWTAKEAIVKATGEGIVAGLNNFCVKQSLSFMPVLKHTHPRELSLICLSAPVGYAASLASLSPQPSIFYRDFDSIPLFIS